MSSIAHTPTLSRRPGRTRPLSRLSRQAGFWAVAFAFFALTAFATAPSALYGLYAQHEHLSPITLTVVYAVYAVGVVASLLLAGHVSDAYGRRAVLIPGLLVAVVAAVVFLVWTSLPGLLVARLLTGVALGASVATATAYITDLDAGPDGTPSRRSGIVATIANVGGLAVGPLMAGALAQYVPDGLTLTFIVLLAALVVAIGVVARSPRAAGRRSLARATGRSGCAHPRRRAGSSWRRPPARSSPSPSAGCSPDSPAGSWPGRFTTRPPS